MGFVAAFSVVILLVLGIYFFGYAVRKSSVAFVMLSETIIGLAIILPLIIFVDKLSPSQIFTELKMENWLWLGAAALFGYAGGTYFSLLNLKTAGEKSNSLLSPAITVLTLALSFLIFHERFLLRQWLGILITLAAVIYFLLKNKSETEVHSNNSRQGFITGSATIVCISISIICSIKGALTNVTLLQAIWIRLLLALFIILPYFLFSLKKKNVQENKPKLNLAILAGVICQTVLANYLWFYASFKIGISVFQLILATLPLFVYAIDVYLLRKSKYALPFLLVSVIAAMGICLVAF